MNIIKLNGEIYGNKKVYQEFYVQEALDKLIKPEVLGEISPRNSPVDLPRVSHQFTELKIEDGYLVGNLCVLDTPYGNILRTLIDGGVDVRFAIRGLGKMDEDCVIYDLEILSIDLISSTS